MTRPYMKGERRKQQILECAKKLFSKKGYHNTHVEDIHKEARIAKGTFYEYFKNKEELFIALLVKFLEDWEEAVLDTTANLVMEDIRTYYRTLIKRSLVFFQSNEDLCNIYLRVGPGTDEVFEPYIEQFEDKMLQYVKNDLDRGVKAGVLRDDLNIELMANILLGAFLRIDYYYFVLKREEKESRDLDGITDQFFNLIMEGIFSNTRGTGHMASRSPASRKPRTRSKPSGTGQPPGRRRAAGRE
ncbi:MAG: TetR/AcrR family transcriptional regulator [Desulfobacterota bacterium]|nr:TetR/AcrR family transcriptional regulator [Thermodesulfobacteriota bacterium]